MQKDTVCWIFATVYWIWALPLWVICEPIHYPVYMDLMISEIRMNFTRTFQKLLLHTFSHPRVGGILFTPFTIYIQVHTRMYINTAALHCTLKNLNKHFKNFLKISLYFKFSAKTMVESGAGKHNSDPGATDTQHCTLNLVFSLFAFGYLRNAALSPSESQQFSSWTPPPHVVLICSAELFSLQEGKNN